MVEELDKVRENYQNSKSIYDKDYDQLQEIINKFEPKIRNVVGEEAFSVIEPFISRQTSAYEDYGFITGFKYATRLMHEAMS